MAVHRRQLLRTVLGGAVLTGTATGATADSDGVATGPTVYFGAGETVYAVDAATGKSVWTFTAEPPNGDTVTITSEPTVVDGTLYVGAGAMLYALDAATGDVEWRTDVFTGHIPNAPTVVDGSVFLGGSVGYAEDHRALRVFDADTGTQTWTFDGPHEVTSSVNVVDETAYFGSRQGVNLGEITGAVYAVDASTGAQEWTFEGPVGPVGSSPTVMDETVYVGATQRGDSGRNRTLYALDGSTGEIDWTYTDPSEVLSSPVVSGGTVYTGGGNLHAVDAQTGERTWTFTDFDVDAPTGVVLLSPPTVSNGTVFVGTYGSQRRHIYAVDAKTGELTWVTRSQSRRNSDGTDVTPTTSDGSLYFGADALYSLDIGTGEEEWRFDAADGLVTAAPTVVASPDEGHSVGSRVSLGTLGHHHTFADREPPESDEPDDPGTGPDGELTGTVTDIDGRPLAGATVRIYDATGDSDAVIARVTTDEDGTYAVGGLETDSGDRPDDVLLVARDGEWFRSVGIDNLREQLPLEYDIELDSQLLFGPEVAADDRPLSALTCWRRVVERQRQTVFLEAVNLASSGPRHEITADPADLTDGAFALTVLADDVWINFGSQSDVGGTVPGRVEIVGLDTSTDHAGLADWHPTRTGLPLYQVGGEVDAPFGRISTADADVADAIDEGFGTIAGIVPGISELLTWLDTIQWAFGERLESEAILGAETVTYPDPSDPSATQTRVDPNNHTMAQLAWRSDNRIPNANEGAVVMAAPLEFQYDDERTTQVTAEAEWTHQNAHVSFGASFDVGPVGTEEKNDD